MELIWVLDLDPIRTRTRTQHTSGCCEEESPAASNYVHKHVMLEQLQGRQLGWETGKTRVRSKGGAEPLSKTETDPSTKQPTNHS